MAQSADDQSIAYFSPLKLRPFLELASEAGIELAEVLLAHGTTESEMTNPDTRLPRIQCIAIMRTLLGRLNDPLAGLRAAERALLKDVDVLGYLAQHSATALAAVETSLRYARLVGDASEVTVVHAGNEVTFTVGLSGSRSSLPELADFAVASGHVSLCLLTGGSARVLRVELARPRPRDARAYRGFFQAPVTFGAGRGKIVYAAAELLAPLPQSDARLASLLAQQAEARLLQLPELSTLIAQVRSHLRQEMETGAPTLASVAAKLHWTERTLRRRLHAAGGNFRQLLDDVRLERALQLLDAGELSVSAIALELGFSDATAFGRAFRRWTGSSPSQRRVRAQHGC